MFSRDIGIDLGTANVLIYVKGQGVVLNEPSVIAMDTDTKQVLAVGEEARRMVGRTPGNIIATRPLRDGVIADFEVTELMLTHFIDKINVKGFLKKPRILICTPTHITSVEQKAIRQAAERSGGKQVYLEEEPKVAAVGAGMDIFSQAATWSLTLAAGQPTSPYFQWATLSPLSRSNWQAIPSIAKF
ncbi:rod shape-determining protein MreB [Sporolactobacillus inulinus]|uniref:Rod shape-determining protein MreB n=1 Tax=Sporolactobacillus inulinus TaxID=2078 RepID=A0A4Y1ZB29_9BACL|nr:rod shape-determining protein MreB [Sporolactobacillus inulinus]